MKKVLFGLIIGVFMSGSITFAVNHIIASKTDIPVLVDGNIINPENPVMIINNKSYFSAKDVANISGKPVNWNNELKRIEFGSISKYNSGALSFRMGDISLHKGKSKDSLKPKDGNLFLILQLKVINTGKDTVYFNKNDLYIETEEGKQVNMVSSPSDSYLSNMNLGSYEYNKIKLLFEISSKNFGRVVSLVYKPKDSEAQLKIPVRLVIDID